MSKYFGIALFAIGFVFFGNTSAKAQGGIGNMPRQDLVMLSAVTRDSISDIMLSEIKDLQRYAEAGMLDSAAAIMAFDGTPGKWSRPINLNDSSERNHAQLELVKISKIFSSFPEMHPQYYACFKDKDNPAGQKHLYQIKQANGKKTRMVSWVFFPIGDKLMFGMVS